MKGSQKSLCFSLVCSAFITIFRGVSGQDPGPSEYLRIWPGFWITPKPKPPVVAPIVNNCNAVVALQCCNVACPATFPFCLLGPPTPTCSIDGTTPAVPGDPVPTPCITAVIAPTCLALGCTPAHCSPFACPPDPPNGAQYCFPAIRV